MADAKKTLGGLGAIAKRMMAPPDEGALSAIRAAGRTAQEEGATARAAMNAQVAEQMARLPARSRKAGEEAGLFHPVGGGIKLSKPTRGMHSTTVADPMFNPPDIGIITPERLVKEKAAIIPLIGDRAAGGRYLTHIDENELETPVRLTAGPRYMDANYNAISPEDSAAWESGLSVVTKVGNQAQRAGQGGRPVYGIYTAGSGTNTDFNVMGANALIQQIPFSKISKKAEREFDRAMRVGTEQFPPVPNWPGIRSPDAQALLLDKSNGIMRTKLFGTMGKENFQSMGFPDVPATRKAIIEPELLDIPGNQAGFRLAKMDTNKRIIENPNIPSDYPKAMAGKVAGKLDVPADYKDIFQTHFDARRLLSQPEKGDYYSFSRSTPIQYADEEWLNRLMEQRLATDRMIKEGGYKEGGAVDIDAADRRLSAAIEKRMATGGAVDIDAADARLRAAIDARMGMSHGGVPHMIDGGKVVKGATSVFKKLFKEADVLPVAEREANFAKFIAPSTEKRKMYHGTTAKEKSGEALRTLSGEDAPYRGGVQTFVTTNPKFASNYAEGEGGNVLPVFAQIKNPFDFRDKFAGSDARSFWRDNGGIDKFDADKIKAGLGLKPSSELTEQQFVRAVEKGHWPALEAPEFAEWLKGQGHDAIVTKEGGSINYGIYEPNKIKSAIGNRGTYDIGESDMSKADGGKIIKGATSVFKKLFADAPGEVAHKLAQERAALPPAKGGLGLPKNNTSEQRAAAMGTKTDAYHGTKQNITGAFKPGYDDNLAFVTKSPEFANNWIGKGKNQTRVGKEAEEEVKAAEEEFRKMKYEKMDYESLNEMKGEPFHAEYDKRNDAFKKEFQETIGLSPDKTHNTVYPLKVQANKTFNPETDMNVMTEFFEKNNIPKSSQDLYASGNYMMYETKPVVEYLKGKGYDSMRLRESTGDDYPTIAVFNPETIRSRFAAFDPFRRDVATAAAMGVAAPDLLAAEPEKKADGGKIIKGITQIGKRLMADNSLPALEAELKLQKVLPESKAPMRLYHGSPHRFPPTAKNPLGEFDASKIGTGEGAQAYGHGLYFAENPGVAKGYQKDLANFEQPFIQSGKTKVAGQDMSNLDLEVFKYLETGKKDAGQFPHNTLYYAKQAAINKPEVLEKLKTLGDNVKFGHEINRGSLYKVDLPDEQIAKMLDWDKTLSEQAPSVQAAINKQAAIDAAKYGEGGGMDYYRGDPDSYSGESIYHYLSEQNSGAIPTSEMLREMGIPGIKYLDAGSRDAGEGTRNFVVFPGNEDMAKIVDREKKGGVIHMTDGGGAFKTLQWVEPQRFGVGGGASEDSGYTSKPYEQDETTFEKLKRNAPATYDWAAQNIKDEVSKLKNPRAVKDFALRTGAQYLGGIPDLANLGLMGVDYLTDQTFSSDKPYFGSEQYIDLMRKAGMLGENEFPIAETVAGILMPAGLVRKGVKKAAQLYKGKKPEAPNKRRGGLAAMAR